MSTLKVGEIKHENFTGTTQLKLDSAGRVLVGTDTKGQADADDFTVANSGSGGITIRTGNSNNANIFFSDATSGSAEYAGYLQYKHDHDRLDFGTATSTRMTIDSSGDVGIGTTSPSGASGKVLEINGGSGQARFVLKNNTTGSASTDGHQIFSDGTTLGIQNREAGNTTFETNGSERMRIDSSGYVGIGTTSPARKFVVTEATANRIANFTTGGSSGAFIAFLDSNTTDDSKCRIGSIGGNVLGMRGDSHSFQDGAGNTRMQIDSSGRLLLGTTTAGESNGDEATFANTGGNAGITIRSAVDAEAKIYFSEGTSGGSQYRGSITYNQNTNYMSFGTNENERVRIDSSGTLFIGKTSQSSGTPGVELYDNGPNFMTRDASGGSVLGLNDQNSTTGDALKIYYSDVLRGSLVYNGSSFFAYTASDYRLKENDTPISDGITRVKQLRPVRFNWKKDATKTYDGFIAHEVQEVVPDCVVGEKDAEVDSREEGYQRLAVAGLVPVLTAALKDAIGKIEILETKVAALEAA